MLQKKLAIFVEGQTERILITRLHHFILDSLVKELDIFRAKVLQCNLRGQNNQGEEHGQQN